LAFGLPIAPRILEGGQHGGFIAFEPGRELFERSQRGRFGCGEPGVEGGRTPLTDFASSSPGAPMILNVH